MHVMSPFLFSLLIAAAPASAQAPQQTAKPSFQGLFVDWSRASEESIEAEREGARLRASANVTAAESAAAGSEALGLRVGEVVSVGDCAEGERLARAAGDFALVAAVREHCTVSETPVGP